jgi:hypothetical protein
LIKTRKQLAKHRRVVLLMIWWFFGVCGSGGLGALAAAIWFCCACAHPAESYGLLQLVDGSWGGCAVPVGFSNWVGNLGDTLGISRLYPEVTKNIPRGD